MRAVPPSPPYCPPSPLLTLIKEFRACVFIFPAATSLIEPLPPDEASLDATGQPALCRGSARLDAAEIRRLFSMNCNSTPPPARCKANFWRRLPPIQINRTDNMLLRQPMYPASNAAVSQKFRAWGKLPPPNRQIWVKNPGYSTVRPREDASQTLR
ncbi:hypothetical protein KCP76_15255 [Salmonella enterica subsp. enterica serovar Weltevreden]|nr:hypothetical protein KCP76_15255 [Salmonella enterica subsp. enterica serovar Weltevreden]